MHVSGTPDAQPPSESGAAGCGSVEPPSSGPGQWPEAHGDALYAFALSRVREAAVAEDLVQETFLAAIKSYAHFAGRSTERAWLMGILRNKMADYYRQQKRRLAGLAGPEVLAAEEDDCFHTSGIGKDGWVMRLAPRAWPSPDEELIRKEFRDVFRRCLDRLPEQAALVFRLRELDDVSSETICKDLGLSPNNLWVILHRSRMALRRCLELNWFGGPAATGTKPGQRDAAPDPGRPRRVC